MLSFDECIAWRGGMQPNEWDRCIATLGCETTHIRTKYDDKSGLTNPSEGGKLPNVVGNDGHGLVSAETDLDKRRYRVVSVAHPRFFIATVGAPDQLTCDM